MYVCFQEERKERTDHLLARAEEGHTDGRGGNGTDSTGNGLIEEETLTEKAAFGEEGVSDVSGARQQQLASLLCKAEQYSMFIRESQVGGREGKVESLPPVFS